MDLEKLSNSDKEHEARVKTLLELSTKKYNLRKELESLNRGLAVKQGDVKKLQESVVLLRAEVPVLEKQEEIVKSITQDLKEQVSVKETEIERIQEEIWGKINGFISEAKSKLAPRAKNGTCSNNRRNSKNGREAKLRLLKLESEAEVMELYKKYQGTRIEELKLIRDWLEEDSFII